MRKMQSGRQLYRPVPMYRVSHKVMILLEDWCKYIIPVIIFTYRIKYWSLNVKWKFKH